MNSVQMYEFILLALCIWREARGESVQTKQAVAWSIRNRVQNPGWWGTGWAGIILQPYQYSSFNRNDPNAAKLPIPKDPSWEDSLEVAQMIYTSGADAQLPDPTGGATSYFDLSLDHNPPSWAIDGGMVKTCDVGRLHFYRKA